MAHDDPNVPEQSAGAGNPQTDERLEKLRRLAEKAAELSEENRHTIKFMLHQQAQFSTNIGMLTETVALLGETVAETARAQRRSEERWERTEAGIRSLLAIAEMHEQEMDELREQVGDVSEQVAANSEAGRATDERLNALIAMFERYIANRNGS